MNSLNGRVALVTGASSGIGASTAGALAASGATVVLVARRAERLEAVARGIRHAGGACEIAVADVTDQSSIHAAVDQAVERVGRLDIVIAAAGCGVAAPFSETLPAEYRDMVDVNYLGVLHTVHATLPTIEKGGAGHLVLVSSGTGRFIHPSVVYSGTKHAVSAMAESLRRELTSKRIRVTCIEPGAVDTDFIARMRPEVGSKVNARLEGIEMLQPSDVSDAILYAVQAPRRVNVSIVTIYPTAQP